MGSLTLRVGLLLVLLLGVGGAGVLMVGGQVPPRDLGRLAGDPERGAYVLRMAGCVACHTESGGALLAGGAPIETDFGRFRGPNITPDPETGIGGWTLEQFSAALTAGLGPGGRHYYPVFPYASYAAMHDQDIVDLWAYLETVEPASAGPVDQEVPFPLSMRPLLAGWKLLHLEPGPYRAVSGRSEAWNRGAYLVNGPGHCGECHTPRTWLGGLDRDRHLQGSSAGPGGERIPPITADEAGIGGWSKGDLVFALELGLMPDGDSLGGSMGEVVEHATSHLTLEDLEAIATYLLGE